MKQVSGWMLDDGQFFLHQDEAIKGAHNRQVADAELQLVEIALRIHRSATLGNKVLLSLMIQYAEEIAELSSLASQPFEEFRVGFKPNPA